MDPGNSWRKLGYTRGKTGKQVSSGGTKAALGKLYAGKFRRKLGCGKLDTGKLRRNQVYIKGK